MTRGTSLFSGSLACVVTAISALFIAQTAAASNLQLETDADSARRPASVDIKAGEVGLNMQNGVTNHYVSDNASLSMVNGARVNLNFAVADIVRAPLLRSAAQAAYGYSNALAQNRHVLEQYVINEGALTLIPEPSTWVMTIVGASLLLSVQRFRKKKN